MRSRVPCRKCGTKSTQSGFVFKNVEGKCICRVCYASLRRSGNDGGENSGIGSTETPTATPMQTDEGVPFVIDLEAEVTDLPSHLRVTGSEIVAEINRLQTFCFQNFNSGQTLPVYDPEKFEEFCMRAGAPNIFQLFLACMTSTRHSKARKALNQKRCVSLVLQICFGLSQKCDFFQLDNGIFLKFAHCTSDGIDTQRNLGTACCSRSVDRALAHYAITNNATVTEAISHAIEKKQLLLLMIDDYTTIHSHRRPTDLSTNTVLNMCTIIIKIFPELDAIPIKNPELVHPPKGIDNNNLKSLLCSEQQMSQIAQTFSSCMPEMTTPFFDPLMERKRLEAHDYGASPEIQYLRKFDNVHLIDFIKLPLKSKENYLQALDIVTNTKLGEYLSKFQVLLPADYPGQFYPRKIVYELLEKYRKAKKTLQLVDMNPLLSLVPMIGPLHIDLNSDEDLMLNFLPILRHIYEAVFPGKHLADHPKPWRTQFTLEMVYGGWTLIRRMVKTVFKDSKDLQYGTLLNILDNYCPLILTSYNVLFKTNNFDSYYDSIIRVWIMMYCFRRRHYNKVLLIWLSLLDSWKCNTQTKDLYNLFSKNLCAIDESTVEYVHSVIRRHTTDAATEEQLKQTIKAIFGSNARQCNFRSVFMTPKNYVFSRVQLKYLYIRVANVLVNLFVKIANNPANPNPLPRHSHQKKDCEKYILPELFGEKPVNNYFLPLGYQCQQKPDPQRRCDELTCSVTEEQPWTIFEGCWHSFHITCLAGREFCYLCKAHLENEIDKLVSVVNATLLGKEDDEPLENVNDQIDDDNDEDILDDMGLSGKVTNCDATLNNINSILLGITPQSPPVVPEMQENNAPISNSGITSSITVKNIRPPHCTKCKHAKIGHGRTKLIACKCPMCPSQTCSDTGSTIPCTCNWHLSNQPISG